MSCSGANSRFAQSLGRLGWFLSRAKGVSLFTAHYKRCGLPETWFLSYNVTHCMFRHCSGPTTSCHEGFRGNGSSHKCSDIHPACSAIVKSFVSDPGISCLPPTRKLWQANLFIGKKSKTADPSQFLKRSWNVKLRQKFFLLSWLEIIFTKYLSSENGQYIVGIKHLDSVARLLGF